MIKAFGAPIDDADAKAIADYLKKLQHLKRFTTITGNSSFAFVERCYA